MGGRIKGNFAHAAKLSNPILASSLELLRQTANGEISMSDAPSQYADRLHACLDSEVPDRALVAMSEKLEELLHLPEIDEEPHPLVGLAMALMANALNRCGKVKDVSPFLNHVSDLYAKAHQFSVHGSSYILSHFPYLWNPIIVASIAMQYPESFVATILSVADLIRHRERSDMPDDPTVRSLLTHPAIAAYGPFCIERGWLLERQADVLRSAALDRSRDDVYDFEELFILNALLTEQPERALPLIESRGLSGDTPVAFVGDKRHLEFNAVCVLSTLGRFDEALALARLMVRSGYSLRWRFNLETTGKDWTQSTRQNEWLGPLSQTPAYQTFLKEYVRHEPFPAEDPAANALCALREDIWDGKKKKRCWLSKKLIAPGEPVVRVRRLVGHALDGDFDIARKDVFEQSGWVVTRQQFKTDTIPLTALFPDPRRLRSEWDCPAISVFHWEIARDPATFDLRRAVTIIADHRPNKIRRMWLKDKYREMAFEPMVDDRGHGDAVNFAWRLLKAGLGPALFEQVSRLPPAKADKVFAMLTMFDRPDCRRAAADHFSLPDLPEMIDRAFSERPSLDTHLAMADFADRNPRWRAALVEAMSSYALHLYSNCHPGADWILQGLEHFSRAHCCQLLYFLIHHPEDDEVLATMIEKEWLPDGVGAGMFDAYDNARKFYYRTVVLNRMLHAPEQLNFWLQSDLVTEYCKGSKDRETRRLVERWQKTKAKKR
jgi:hypothetical protein